MATVLSFVCTTSSSGWTAKCCNNAEVNEISADDRWSLEKLLKEETLSRSSGGGVSSAFSWVTPKTAIYQFTVGGAVAVAAGGGAAAAAAPEEAKKEEEKPQEGEDSDDSGSEPMFGLFD